MNYYYDLKIYSNVSRSLVPNLLSFKQEIVKFKRKKISSELLNGIKILSFSSAWDEKFNNVIVFNVVLKEGGDIL